MKRPKLWEWLVCAGIVIVVAAVLWPVTACACSKASPRTACLANVKMLGTGMQIYVADYDERLPDRDKWMDSLLPYTKNESLFVDPLIKKVPGQYGYAFDSHLSGQLQSSIKNRDQQPMIYDSLNLGRNASDPFTSLPSPGRHDGKNNIGYLDGHVKAVLYK